MFYLNFKTWVYISSYICRMASCCADVTRITINKQNFLKIENDSGVCCSQLSENL